MSKIEVELLDIWGTDADIVNAAWVSSKDRQSRQTPTIKDCSRVIGLLAEGGHSTPFESVYMRFWVRHPIMADRQFVTYRLATHNGLSGRYRRVPTDLLDTPEDIKTLLRQLNLKDTFVEDSVSDLGHQYLTILAMAHQENNVSSEEYKRLREYLRGILPQVTMTERVTCMNLVSFSNFIRQRLSEHAQPEIRQSAAKMLKLVKESGKIPIALDYLEKAGWTLQKPNFSTVMYE